MKEIRFNKLKSERLKKVRGVSFEEIVRARLICIQEHPSRKGQYIMFYDYKGYIWVVPFIEEIDYMFLKTLYPSRRYTKMYKRGALP
jgi:hypothetical protein